MLRQLSFKFLIFLHMNYIKKYNNEMGGDGTSDNIRNYYRIYILGKEQEVVLVHFILGCWCHPRKSIHYLHMH